jgi:hypothetical protein
MIKPTREFMEFEITTMIETLVCLLRNLPKNSLNTQAYLKAVDMLKSLDKERGVLDLPRWEEEINSLPGGNDQGIQNALQLARDLQSLWIMQAGQDT